MSADVVNREALEEAEAWEKVASLYERENRANDDDGVEGVMVYGSPAHGICVVIERLGFGGGSQAPVLSLRMHNRMRQNEREWRSNGRNVLWWWPLTHDGNDVRFEFCLAMMELALAEAYGEAKS